MQPIELNASGAHDLKVHGYEYSEELSTKLGADMTYLFMSVCYCACDLQCQGGDVGSVAVLSCRLMHVNVCYH